MAFGTVERKRKQNIAYAYIYMYRNIIHLHFLCVDECT